jgi:hypothetical protein
VLSDFSEDEVKLWLSEFKLTHSQRIMKHGITFHSLLAAANEM